MLVDGLQMREIDARAASDADLARLNAFANRIRSESWSDDPAVPVEETARDLRAIPSYVSLREWVVEPVVSGEIVGSGAVSIRHELSNQHVAMAEINVLPEMRRRGIARELLRLVVAEARATGRTLLIGYTNTRAPSGAAFAERIGARMGLAMQINQLRIADLDRPLMADWLARGEALRDEFDLGLWDGPYPEEDLQEVIRLGTVMNTAPRDDLEVEDEQFTAEQVRQYEASLRERRRERWTMYVRERATGRLVGYTQVFWGPERPDLLSQGDTGVFPEYRNRGLGTWLKAAMIDKVLRERPQITLVRTGNAHSNAPMVRINRQMGFQLYQSTLHWQAPVEAVLAYFEGQ